MPLPIVLLGYGPVARGYAAVLRARRTEFRGRYGVDPRVVAIRGRERQILIPDGGEPPDRSRWAARTPLGELLAAAAPAVVAQAVPSHPAGAAEALADGLTSLAARAHLVTATKSPLLTGWSELHAAAHRYGRDIRISGATGAALPAGDLARTGLRGFEVDEVGGCVNGTASFVLDRLGAGMTPGAAAARDRGIAEADATADLSGADAATKIRLLAGLLWGWDVAACRVDAEPITAGTADRAVRASGRGAVLRQIASARAGDPGRVLVALREFPRTAVPFGALTGPEKAVEFRCGEAGDITVSGGRSSPLGAALAMVKDTLALPIDLVSGRARTLPVVE
ncbi:MAG: homoserine dehydrogenase [Nocardia sp.]|nr:homoserine dehydrogenase [Nocardia sp.]